MKKITKKNDRKTWEKILARRGKPGGLLPSRTASKHGVISKPSKYHAKPTMSYGIRFDSMKEADRYQELLLRAKAGEITSLNVQPEYELHVNGILIGHYVGDFYYLERSRAVPNWFDRVVEDVKGFKTPLYRWKKKHVEAQYGIVIREL